MPPLEEPEFIPRLTEDETKYQDGGDFPSTPDGDGSSLSRLLPAELGFNGSSWVGAPPTPGSFIDHPIVVSVDINGGIEDPADLSFVGAPTSWARQRSDIRSLVITFSENVTADLDSLTLTNLGINAPVDADTPIDLQPEHFDLQGNVITLSFDAGFLTPGVYDLRIDATVMDAEGNPLDGNEDGVGGEAFVMTGNGVNSFHVVPANFNGDLGVSIFDFPTFSYWFGQFTPRAPEYVDLNGDGGISIFDFPVFSERFGTLLTPPVALATAGIAEEGATLQLDAAVERVLVQELDGEGEVVERAAVAPDAVQLQRPTVDDDTRPARDQNDVDELESVLDAIADDIAGEWK